MRIAGIGLTPADTEKIKQNLRDTGGMFDIIPIAPGEFLSGNGGPRVDVKDAVVNAQPSNTRSTFPFEEVCRLLEERGVGFTVVGDRSVGDRCYKSGWPVVVSGSESGIRTAVLTRFLARAEGLGPCR